MKREASHVVDVQMGGRKRLPVYKPVDGELSDELRRDPYSLRSPIPKTRAECPVARPCPYACKHNAWIVSGLDQPGRRWVGGNHPPTKVVPTVDQNCVADYGDAASEKREPIEAAVIAAVLGVSDRQVRRDSASALAQLPARLREALERDDERATAVALLGQLMGGMRCDIS